MGWRNPRYYEGFSAASLRSLYCEFNFSESSDLNQEKLNYEFCVSKINIDSGWIVVKPQLQNVENYALFRSVCGKLGRSQQVILLQINPPKPHHCPHLGQWGYSQAFGHRALGLSPEETALPRKSHSFRPLFPELPVKKRPPLRPSTRQARASWLDLIHWRSLGRPRLPPLRREFHQLRF